MLWVNMLRTWLSGAEPKARTRIEPHIDDVIGKQRIIRLGVDLTPEQEKALISEWNRFKRENPSHAVDAMERP
jgi:hypothetical protein